MRILIISSYLLYGDLSCSFVHNQAKALAKMGHDIHVLLPIAFGKRNFAGKLIFWPQKINVEGVSIEFLPYLSLSNFGQSRFNEMSLYCFTMLYNIASKICPEIILAHAITNSSKLAVFLKKRIHVPVVLITHGSDVSLPYERGQISSLRAICDEADQLVAVSSVLAEKLRASGTKTPIYVILNGYQLQLDNQLLKERPFSIIQVGSLIKQKRAQDTITAVSMLKKRYPETTLTIIGNGPERQTLEQQCKQLGIYDSVRFLGRVDNTEVLAEMARHRFFVMPSVREGFGIVYLEAMASGCVTIGTEGEGIVDFIRHGENGYLVPADSPNILADLLIDCIEHPEQADAVARQGRIDALHQTWEKNAKDYLALFETLTRNEDLI